MERGLYIAASGMVAEQARQDRVAADLANASTPGYKPAVAPQESFGSLLLERTGDGSVVGSLDEGVAASTPVVELAEGPLKETDEPLDLAIAGAGFFAVQQRLNLHRRDLTDADTPAAAYTPTVTIRQPYVQNVRRDRGVVMWATQSPGSGCFWRRGRHRHTTHLQPSSMSRSRYRSLGRLQSSTW